MKNYAVYLAAALGLSACADGADSFSFASLNFANSTQSFSGLPLTTMAQMPTANATYAGHYTVEDAFGFDGAGTAAMELDFAASTANLILEGDVQGNVPGFIVGTKVGTGVGAITTTFNGDFYGEQGEVVAGKFRQTGDFNNILDGAYIVSR